MSLSMAQLLIHSEQVPAAAREALRAAYDGLPEDRGPRLVSAANVLREATNLECRDIRELVDLPVKENCG